MNLNIFVTNKCNSNCVFCGHTDKCAGIGTGDRIALIKNIIKESGGIDKAFILGGEPTVDDGLIYTIQSIRDCGIKDVCLITNGHRLVGQSYRRGVLSSGVSRIDLSLMAVKADDQMRINRTNNALSINDLREIYNDCVRSGVEFNITTNVWQGNNDTLSKAADFYNNVKDVCDSVRFNQLIGGENCVVKEMSDSEYLKICDGLDSLRADTPIIVNRDTSKIPYGSCFPWEERLTTICTSRDNQPMAFSDILVHANGRVEYSTRMRWTY